MYLTCSIIVPFEDEDFKNFYFLVSNSQAVKKQSIALNLFRKLNHISISFLLRDQE